MAIIGITGGTGTIGRTLCKYLLDKGHQVIVLCRAVPRQKQKDIQYALWNPHKRELDATALANAEYLINLAGAGVADKRWSVSRKKEIAESRIASCETLVQFLQTKPNKVKGVVSMSAIGWYGPDRGKVFTEDDSPYEDFLGNTCKAWEESIAPVSSLGRRLVILRTGIVLSKEGGALAEFIKPVRFGIAPVLGTGKQMISWIHVHDLCRMIEWGMENENIEGVYNAVAPNPVSNKELMLTLARILRGRIYIPARVPAFILKLMLGEMSIEVLKSATASSKKMEEAGFKFIHENVEQALENLINQADNH
jgi:uncharacterized protein (TIGR01777 family)